jgi:hypothetical protein
MYNKVERPSNKKFEFYTMPHIVFPMTTRTTPSKSQPVPTRFTAEEGLFLKRTALETGLPVSEIVRRSVRLMKRKTVENRGYGLILELAR